MNQSSIFLSGAKKYIDINRNGITVRFPNRIQFEFHWSLSKSPVFGTQGTNETGKTYTLLFSIMPSFAWGKRLKHATLVISLPFVSLSISLRQDKFLDGLLESINALVQAARTAKPVEMPADSTADNAEGGSVMSETEAKDCAAADLQRFYESAKVPEPSPCEPGCPCKPEGCCKAPEAK